MDRSLKTARCERKNIMGKTCFAGKKKFPHLFSPIRIGNIRTEKQDHRCADESEYDHHGGPFYPGNDRLPGGKSKRRGRVWLPMVRPFAHSATGKSHNKQLQLDSFRSSSGTGGGCLSRIHNAGGRMQISSLSHGGHVWRAWLPCWGRSGSPARRHTDPVT